MNSRIKKSYLLFSAFALLSFIFLTCIAIYIISLKSTVESEARTYLRDSSHLGASYIKHQLDGTIEDLTGMADFIGRGGDIFSAESSRILQKKTSRTMFCRYSVVDMFGMCKTLDGTPMNVADREYFKKASVGEANISPVLISRSTGNKVIIFAFPIKKNGKTVGVLRVHLEEDDFSGFFAVPSFGGAGYSAIVEADGDIVSQPYAADAGKNVLPSNIFTALKGIKKLDNVGDINSAGTPREGMVRYYRDGDLRYLYYTSLGINDWYLISITPYSALSDRFSGFIRLTYFVSIFMFIFFVCTMAAIIVIYRRKSKEIQEARRKMAMMAENIPGGVSCCSADDEIKIREASDGYLALLGCSDKEELEKKYQSRFINTVHPDDRERIMREVAEQSACGGDFLLEMEYRLATDNGEELWVFDRGRILNDWDGNKCFYCIVVDITKSRKVKEALELSEERHRIITETADECILDWDAVRRKMYYSPKYKDTFAEFNTDISIIDGLLAEERIYSEDIPRFKDFIGTLTSGKMRKNSIEVRMLTVYGNYSWFRLDAAAITDSKGKMIRLLAMLKNIDVSMKEKLSWKHKAQTDSLTGLYDKGMTENLIKDYLSGEGKSHACVLFVVDIDNFKGINDRFGHPFGDTVLAETAGAMKTLFRDSDIVGRIGGDEFMILMKDINGMGAVYQKAVDLCGIFSRTFDGIGTEDTVKVSGSVGLAFYPENGDDFDTLFSSADMALYSAKRSGKNRYVAYTNAVRDEFDSREITDIHTEIVQDVPEGQKSFDENFAEYIFKILYSSDNAMEAIKLCLGVACRRFNTSRAYIFEYNEDFTEMSCTYEWCQPGVSPIISHYQKRPVSSLPSYKERFADSELFFIDTLDCRGDAEYLRRLRSENVKSMFHCALLDNGILKGFVGFDECIVDRRMPSDTECGYFTFMAKILGTFIAKERSHRSLEKVSICSEALLDSMKQWAYAVDSETYELLYANKGLKEYFPKITEGSVCYRVLKEQEEPCANCPIIRMKGANLENLSVYMDFPLRGISTPLTITKIKCGYENIYLLTLNNLAEIKNTSSES